MHLTTAGTFTGGLEKAQTTETEVLDPHENSQRAVLEHDSPDGNAPDKQPPKIKTPRLKLSRLVLLSVLLIAAAGALSWWLYARNYESPDDAQIEGHIDLVSSRITGTVTYRRHCGRRGRGNPLARRPSHVRALEFVLEWRLLQNSLSASERKTIHLFSHNFTSMLASMPIN
jgi:hypothetical protein